MIRGMVEYVVIRKMVVYLVMLEYVVIVGMVKYVVIVGMVKQLVTCNTKTCLAQLPLRNLTLKCEENFWREERGGGECVSVSRLVLSDMPGLAVCV